jgi:hypothetical protein
VQYNATLAMHSPAALCLVVLAAAASGLGGLWPSHAYAQLMRMSLHCYCIACAKCHSLTWKGGPRATAGAAEKVVKVLEDAAAANEKVRLTAHFFSQPSPMLRQGDTPAAQSTCLFAEQ